MSLAPQLHLDNYASAIENVVNVGKYKHNSRGYLELVVKKTWHKQVEILDSIRDNIITIIRSANDVGKTLAVATAILWVLDCWRPYAKCITTARNFYALQYMLWARIRSIYGKLKPRFNNASMDYLSFKPDPINHPEWFAVGYNPEIKGDEAEAFQGHHAPPAPSGVESLCVFFIDEAITTPYAVLKAIEGSLFSEGTKLVAVYNPVTKNSPIVDYESDPRANIITISQYDLFQCDEFIENPEYFDELANPDRTAQFIATYGKDSPIVKARVLGEYPEDSEDSAIPYSVCMMAKNRFDNYDPENEKVEVKEGEKFDGFRIGQINRIVYGWDVAGAGSDFNVLARMICGEEGMLLQRVRKWHKGKEGKGIKLDFPAVDTPQLRDRLYVNDVIQKDIDKYSINIEGTDEKQLTVDIFLVPDAVGEGSDIPSLFASWQPKIYVTGFKAGGKSRKIPERREMQTLNAVSEAWYRTRLLFGSEIDSWLPIAADLDRETIHQLSTRKYDHSVKAKEPLIWYVEPKEKYKERNRGKSPDDADGVVITIWGYFSVRVARFATI